MSWPAELTSAKYISLETFRRDGTGVKTPVWFAELDGLLGVFTNGKSYKVKRLRRDSKVRVAACDLRGGVAEGAPWFDAEGTLVTDEALKERVYRALKAKYGWQMGLITLSATLSGRRKHWEVIAIERSSAEL
ncbi:MAG: PPOX class F420-dependent oxidoreductase [Polyangiaceae bacterium]|nr:PPOX class F420-dependent oxidoreductase [Polyangiaceae bacterium]MCW5789289.1 PPOX class F420-dependent oxidoreductase [Polyangiaceae bacterium]